MTLRLAICLATSALLLAACDNAPDSDIPGALFTVRACHDATTPGETFRVRIHDADVIAEAEQIIASGEQRIISGPLRRGNGGFNENWSWHLDPDSVEFADFTIELCDGCPHMVEDDLDYWIDTVGRYCPWSTQLVARVE